MKKRCSIMLFIFVTTVQMIYAQLSIGDSTAVFFASVSEAKKILTNRDDFVVRMSPFDRAARMKTDRNVSEKEYLEFVGKNILPWKDAEIQKVKSAFEGIQSELETLALPFPEKILLIKTSGAEEGGAAYTRANAIVFPQFMLMGSPFRIRRLLCHELFHVLSRDNPELCDELYNVIGFIKCRELEFPLVLSSRKITNPDAPKNDHCIQVQVDGKKSWAIPILYSNNEKYDMTRGGEFFSYLRFEFLIIEREGQAGGFVPAYDAQNLKLVDPQQVSGFQEQVGKNTGYIIHPEEILADNFAFILMGNRNVSSPEIITELEKILKNKKVAKVQ